MSNTPPASRVGQQDPVDRQTRGSNGVCIVVQAFDGRIDWLHYGQPSGRHR